MSPPAYVKYLKNSSNADDADTLTEGGKKKIIYPTQGRIVILLAPFVHISLYSNDEYKFK